MTPPAATTDLASSAPDVAVKPSSRSRLTSPLKYSGSLDSYQHFDTTGVIGREFPTLQLSSILHDDTKVRDLGILVAERGVVFFRNQDLRVDDQKLLGIKLGKLTGAPEASTLYKHPMFHSGFGVPIDETGRLDDQVQLMNVNRFRTIDEAWDQSAKTKILSSLNWHADNPWEPVTSDYAVLKMTLVPDDPGGDTVFASTYEAYDRLSPPFQKLAESLMVTHYNKLYEGLDYIKDYRGHPENVGFGARATHPMIRTHPVTGWKCLFPIGYAFAAGGVEGVTEREDQILKQYLRQIVAENHDLQCRIRWQQNDVAIWDNRAVFHAPTNDYFGSRQGVRVLSTGEKPYLDPKSTSRREALAAAAAAQEA